MIKEKIAMILRSLALSLSLIFMTDPNALAACSVPNTFVNGQTADANSVNGNFTALVNCVNSTAGQVRFNYSSATQVLLVPFGGSSISINGVNYSIPAGGVAGANTSAYVNGASGQNLAPATLYRVYIFNNNGTLTLDFWTGSNAGHTTDTTPGNVGVEVRNNGGTPDSTRTLVGMVYTNGSNQFQGQGAGTLSWFNRRRLALFAFAQNSTNSTTSTEVVPAARLTFLTWGDESVLFSLSGQASNAGAAYDYGIGLDSVASIGGYLGYNVNPAGIGMSISFQAAEGNHYSAVIGDTRNAANALTLYANNNLEVRG